MDEILVAFDCEEAKANPERVRTVNGRKLSFIRFLDHTRYTITGRLEGNLYFCFWDDKGKSFTNPDFDLKLVSKHTHLLTEHSTEDLSSEHLDSNVVKKTDEIIEDLIRVYSHKTNFKLEDLCKAIFTEGVNQGANASYKEGYNLGLHKKIELTDDQIKKVIALKINEAQKGKAFTILESALWGARQIENFLNEKDNFLW